MNKKITIIELLNKIANGEEVPKRIKYNYDTFQYIGKWEQYMTEGYDEIPLLRIISNYNYSGLNDEVEILEDNTEEIEEIPQYRIDNCTDYNYCYLAEKYNKLAKAVNQIRKDINK